MTAVPARGRWLPEARGSGCDVLRIHGSHYILRNGTCKTTVPVHGASDLKLGTLKSIQKQTGVKLT